MSTLLLGVSGGIAAYKAVDVLRLLQRDGHDTTVIMTGSARRFVGPATFAGLSGRPVGGSAFGGDDGDPGYDHLDLARSADLLLIAPATANTIARLATGLADDLLGSTFLAFEGPVLVAPAMNTAMYEHPATMANVQLLRERGVQLVGPDSGLLADGAVGAGRLATPEAIVAAVTAALAPSGALAGRRVVVTAGGTREPIDSVRYVGNRSSGKMGWAIAEAARRRGASVTVVAANVALPRAEGIEYVEAPTAAELGEAVRRVVGEADVLFMAAAVADYRPARRLDGKLDKGAADELSVSLERTEDVLSSVAEDRRPGQVLVGFAAEHGPAGAQRAAEKRRRKKVDLIVHNDIADPAIGFGADQNRVAIIGEGGVEELPTMSKDACAARIVDAATALLGAGQD